MPPKAKSNRHGKKRAASSPTPPDSDNISRNSQQPQGEKLLISIDIGTTCSAASFCLQRPEHSLNPGHSPNLEIVSGWPGQISEQDYKVPSVMYYNLNGDPKGWGAESTDPVFKSRAVREGWIRVEWFKLLLKPPHCATGMEYIPELPNFLTIQQVYTDFLTRVLSHIKFFFSKHRADGDELWDELLPAADIVFTIPNGWELKQQYAIRRAAISAGFLGATVVNGRDAHAVKRSRLNHSMTARQKQMTEALERIRFVSESEAAMVYATKSGNVDSWLKEGDDVIVCDVGGGTIDITCYNISKEKPLEIRERFASKCIISGAVLVNQKARDYITEKVYDTTWNTEKKIDQLMDYFERETKKRFKHPADPEYSVGPGGSDEESAKANVRDGMLFIPADDFETFFQPTLSAIKDEVHDIWRRSERTAKNVIMVGGFMNSSYAFQQLDIWGRENGIKFAKPDGTMAKAVSHGALLWHLANPVKGYIVKFHYGSNLELRLPEMSEETIQSIQGRKLFDCVDGTQFVKGGWETIAPMGETLETGYEMCKEVTKWVEKDDPEEVLTHEYKIYVCRDEEVPQFIFDVDGQIYPTIEHACTVNADLRELFKKARWKTNNATGKKYKTLNFCIAIHNGGYNLDAYAFWMHKEDRKSVV